jgi:hypothetical protein
MPQYAAEFGPCPRWSALDQASQKASNPLPVTHYTRNPVRSCELQTIAANQILTFPRFYSQSGIHLLPLQGAGAVPTAYFLREFAVAAV